MVRHTKCFRGWAYTLLVLSFIFSICIVADCTFLRIGLVNTDYGDLAEIGIFEINLDTPDGHRCARYAPDVAISAGFKAARAFGVLCCLALGVAMIQVACLQLVTDYKRHSVWMAVRVEILIACLCQLLTFSAYAEDICGFPSTKCVPGAAGVLAIFNVVILLILIWMYWVLPSPEYPVFELRRRAPPPPMTAPPPTLEEQERELSESVQVAIGNNNRSTAISSGNYRGPAEDDDADLLPPAAPQRKNNSYNDGIENPAVPLDKIDEESF